MTSPAVTIFITGTLRLWTGAGGKWHFITIPEEQSRALRAESLAARRGFGSVKVEATIGDITWRTSVFPHGSGGYILPVKAAVRRDAGITAGDDVPVTLKLVHRPL
jgi:hypothetical protein